MCSSTSSVVATTLSVALWSAGLVATVRQSERSDAVRAAINRAIPLLQSSARTWFNERPCASCHHQGLGIVAVTLARDRGFRVDQSMLDDQVRRTTPAPGWRDRFLLGEVSINEQIGESYRAVARSVAGAGGLAPARPRRVVQPYETITVESAETGAAVHGVDFPSLNGSKHRKSLVDGKQSRDIFDCGPHVKPDVSRSRAREN